MPLVPRGPPSRPTAPETSHAPIADPNNGPLPTTRNENPLATTAINIPQQKPVHNGTSDKVHIPDNRSKTFSTMNASRSPIPDSDIYNQPSHSDIAHHAPAAKTTAPQSSPASQPFLPSWTATIQGLEPGVTAAEPPTATAFYIETKPPSFDLKQSDTHNHNTNIALTEGQRPTSQSLSISSAHSNRFHRSSNIQYSSTTGASPTASKPSNPPELLNISINFPFISLNSNSTQGKNTHEFKSPISVGVDSISTDLPVPSPGINKILGVINPLNQIQGGKEHWHSTQGSPTVTPSSSISAKPSNVPGHSVMTSYPNSSSRTIVGSGKTNTTDSTRPIKTSTGGQTPLPAATTPHGQAVGNSSSKKISSNSHTTTSAGGTSSIFSKGPAPASAAMLDFNSAISSSQRHGSSTGGQTPVPAATTPHSQPAGNSSSKKISSDSHTTTSAGGTSNTSKGPALASAAILDSNSVSSKDTSHLATTTTPPRKKPSSSIKITTSMSIAALPQEIATTFAGTRTIPTAPTGAIRVVDGDSSPNATSQSGSATGPVVTLPHIEDTASATIAPSSGSQSPSVSSLGNTLSSISSPTSGPQISSSMPTTTRQPSSSMGNGNGANNNGGGKNGNGGGGKNGGEGNKNGGGGNKNEGSNSGMSTAERDAIIGGSVAAAVSIITLILVLVALLICRRKQRRHRASYQQQLPDNMINAPGVRCISYVPVIPVNAAPPYFSPPNQKAELQTLEFTNATPPPTFTSAYGDGTHSIGGTAFQNVFSTEHINSTSNSDGQTRMYISQRNQDSATSSIIASALEERPSSGHLQEHVESVAQPLRSKNVTSDTSGYTSVQLGVAL